MARPRMNEEDKKVVLNMRVEPDVYACLQKMSTHSGIAITVLARDLLKNAVRDKIISTWAASVETELN